MLSYPNLELIEYKFREILAKNESWQEKYQKKCDELTNEFTYSSCVGLNITAEMWTQIWPSTCTAFDVDEHGTPMAGGSAMTEAYTVVMHEHLTDTYAVFIGNQPCYLVQEPTEKFLQDVKGKCIASLCIAKKQY